MAEATQEDTTSTGSAADSMIRLLYLEIIRKDDYKQWKKDPQLCRQPNTMDDAMTPEVIQERLDISHLSVHLATRENQFALLLHRREGHAVRLTKRQVRVRDGRAHLEVQVSCPDVDLEER